MRNIAIVVGALVIAGVTAFFLWQHNQSASSAASNGAAMQATAPAAQPAATQPAATTGSTAASTTAPATTTPAAAPAAGQQTADASQPALYADDMYLGKADAKITVIEYASLSCPHCARFNADVLPQIKTNYIDKGLVRWVYRDYPLNNPAYLAAVLTHCASPMRYFTLVDTLFKSQDYWATQQQAIVPLRQIATNEGVDQKTYDACLADTALKDKIISRLQEASTKYKIEATPSFIVEGQVHAGEISYDDFKKLLDAALGHS
ncbi:MAG TPA: DsbA family protein [Candidatus Polarisedimenticolia bacterium]|jgi:protein-disulfide isomerase|nr:DsbA family protein [Dongiaceae bacterium]HYV87199.1 DsbA family protein [Candidatus Polarisedimenticolia bacterium]